jgi:hypothetical protein
MLAKLVFALCALVASHGCSVQPGGAGADCVRSTECELGLVCVNETCTDNLDGLEDQGQVPVLMMEAADAGDGMADAATGSGDASVMRSDAAMPVVDSAMPSGLDGSATPSDSGL